MGETKRKSVYLPGDMIEDMDRMIEEVGFTQNRSSYVTRAMDTMFRFMLSTRLDIENQVESIKKIQEVDPEIIVQITKAAMQSYVQKSEEYTGKKEQLLVTLPSELLEKVETYSKDIGLYDSTDEFIMISICDQISKDQSFLEQLKRVKAHKARVQKSQQDIINDILSKIQKNESGGLDTLVNAAQIFMDASKKE